MKIIKKILKILIIIFVLFSFYSMYIYCNLKIDEEPQVVDVIIVLEGGNDERAIKGVELLKDNYSKANKIIVSPRNITEDSDNAERYLESGATENQLIYDYD